MGHKCIVFERPDGAVSIQYLQYADQVQNRKENDLIALVIRKQLDRLSTKYGGVSVPHVVESDTIPPDGSAEQHFFVAWEWKDNAVICNMSKARAIHMDAIRIVRNAELAAKDITFMRAVEAGDMDAQARITAEKETLRDIPQTFDLRAQTPEGLKGEWPSELPARINSD